MFGATAICIYLVCILISNSPVISACSPLFESDTHGYDTADYFAIDRRLGDVELFKQVVEELHARGMKASAGGLGPFRV